MSPGRKRLALIAGLAFAVVIAVSPRRCSQTVVDTRGTPANTSGQALTEEQIQEILASHQEESDLIKELKNAQYVSVDEGWSKADWIDRFGDPSLVQKRRDALILWYLETDDYFVAKKEYMHGLEVRLKGGETAVCDPMIMHNN